MIKIEITDLRTERPQDLVKLATFLLDFAGHGIAQVSEEQFNKRMHAAKYTPTNFHDVGKTSQEVPPYAHCAESDLTTAILEDSQGNQFEVRAPLNLGHIFKGEDAELPEHSHGNIGKMTPKEFDTLVDELGDALIAEKDHYKNATQELVDQVLPPPVVASKHIDEPIVAEKPKRKRTPSKPKAEECKIQITKVSETDEEETFIVTDFAEIPAPPIETIAPPPPVNGNTVMDKILNALNDQKLTRDEITAIVVKHGLKATRDIFTNDHLIPAIDADIDEALRGK